MSTLLGVLYLERQGREVSQKNIPPEDMPAKTGAKSQDLRLLGNSNKKGTAVLQFIN